MFHTVDSITESKRALLSKQDIASCFESAKKKLTGIRQWHIFSFFSTTIQNIENKLIDLYFILDGAGLLNRVNLQYFENSTCCELGDIFESNQLSKLDKLINILSLIKDDYLTQETLIWILSQSNLEAVETIFRQLKIENKFHNVSSCNQFRALLEISTKLSRSNLATNANLISMIKYSEILLDSSLNLWGDIFFTHDDFDLEVSVKPTLEQAVLNDFFMICENTKDQIERVKQLKNYREQWVRSMVENMRRTNFSLKHEKNHAGDLVSEKNRNITFAEIENAVREMIHMNLDNPKTLLLAFHTDHHRTLAGAFERLKIKQETTDSKYYFLFREDVYRSETIFAELVQVLLPDIQAMRTQGNVFK